MSWEIDRTRWAFDILQIVLASRAGYATVCDAASGLLEPPVSELADILWDEGGIPGQGGPSGSVEILNSGYRAQGGWSRAPRARGKLGFPLGAPTKWSPDRQAQVGDHFGHPQGLQVKALKF